MPLEGMLLPQGTSLPKDPLFSKLLKFATQRGDQIIVDDYSRGTQFGYHHILHGTVKLRQKLQCLLNRSILENRGGFFVALLAPNSYEFIVGTLAVLALGGVVVPMRESLLSHAHQERKKGGARNSAKLTAGTHSDRRTSSRSITYPPAVRCMLSPRWPGANRPRIADPRGSRDRFACD